MLHIYDAFVKTYLAIPAIAGEKTASERFPGAINTYCIEAMMQDRKALQAGTSHFLGQSFAQASDITFQAVDGSIQHVWTTSWGVRTRLIGAMVMVHSDDDGLVLPPRIASSHIVILPITHKEETKADVLSYAHKLAEDLRKVQYYGRAIDVIVDEREIRGGEKAWSWIKKGVPIRMEIGPRDIASGKLGIMRRDKPHKEQCMFSREEFVLQVAQLLDQIHDSIYQKALEFRETHTRKIDTKEEFYKFFTPKNGNKPEIHGGFALCHWSGDEEVEEQVQKDLNVTIRCIPLDSFQEEGICVISGKKSEGRVLFAKSY